MPSGSRSLTLAPASSSALAASMWPPRTAKISAVNLPLVDAALMSAPACEQQPNGVRIVLGRGPHQRGLSAPAFPCIDRSTMREERLHDLRIASARRHHQRRFTARRRTVDVRARDNQSLHDRGVAVGRSEMKGRDAVSVRDARASSGCEKRGGQLCIIVLDGPMQCRGSVRVGGVRIGTLR